MRADNNSNLLITTELLEIQIATHTHQLTL